MKYLLIVLFALSACKSNRNQEQPTEASELVKTAESNKFSPTDEMLLSKKKCRGTCQVFDLRILGSGVVELRAIENMPKIGVFVLTIQPEETSKFFEMAVSAVSNMGDRYYPNVSDFQESTFQLKTSQITKTIEGRHKAPKEYIELLKLLEAIPARDGWTESGNK
jgi:hypothetical protein